MATGWGRDTWGSGPWGGTAVSVSVTGVAGTSAVGSVSIVEGVGVTVVLLFLGLQELLQLAQ